MKIRMQDVIPTGLVAGMHGKLERVALAFMMESANFMTQETRSPLNARLATTATVTAS